MKQVLRKTITITLLIGMCISMMAGCQTNSSSSESQKTRSVTDAAGNVVEVPSDLNKIGVIPIPWASVIYAIDGSSERLTSINPSAMTAYKGSFFEKIDPDFKDIDTSVIAKDFSFNAEELVDLGVQAMVIWDYQTDEAKQLTDLGIVPIMIKNETIEELQASFKTIGQLLGKEERAQEFIDEYNDGYSTLKSFSDKVTAAQKPKVLYLRDSTLKLQGNDNFMKEALDLAGAENLTADLSSITMEEIIKLDPDIILLSNFDAFVPEDLYNNTIAGQDWSQITAVKNKSVYKTPIGIYRWDAPGVETPLMMKWLAEVIQPDIFDFDMKQEIKTYYKTYFDYTVTDADINQILNTDANTNSK